MSTIGITDSWAPAPGRTGLYRIRPAMPADAASASALVRESFLNCAARDWTQSAVDGFLQESNASSLCDKIAASAHATAAFSGRAMIGFILLPVPSRLGMLFVASTFQRMGVGRALWERARRYVTTQYPEVQTIELNSTPYAKSFYWRLGFEAQASEFLLSGCRATRMVIRLRSDAGDRGGGSAGIDR